MLANCCARTSPYKSGTEVPGSLGCERMMCDWVILWVDEILNHLRNPGMIVFPCKGQQTMVSTLVSKWCEMDVVYPQYEVQFPTYCYGQTGLRHLSRVLALSSFVEPILPNIYQVIRMFGSGGRFPKADLFGPFGFFFWFLFIVAPTVGAQPLGPCLVAHTQT